MSARSTLRGRLKTVLRHGTAIVGRVGRTGSRPGDGPRILCYHGVCDEPPDEWSVTPRQLAAHMDLIAHSYTPVALDDIVAWHLDGAPLPPHAVAVTFDDGFADVLEEAAPILARAGVPGTAFIPTALVAGESPDPSYEPTRPFMRWAQVTELAAAGWSIGSHSVNHPRLAALDDAAARRQLVESRDVLEQRLGAGVSLLAYPYGTSSTVSPRDQQLAAEAGYRAAFMDMIGPLERGSDPFALPRAKVLGTDRMPVVQASLRGDMDLWQRVESRNH